jgi:hypothetical protein
LNYLLEGVYDCNGRFCLLNEIEGSKQWFNYSNIYLLSKIAVIWIEKRTLQIIKEHFHYSLIWYFFCREMGRHHVIYRASELSMRSSSFRMCQVVYFGSKLKIMKTISLSNISQYTSKFSLNSICKDSLIN